MNGIQNTGAYQMPNHMKLKFRVQKGSTERVELGMKCLNRACEQMAVEVTRVRVDAPFATLGRAPSGNLINNQLNGYLRVESLIQEGNRAQGTFYKAHTCQSCTSNISKYWAINY